MRQALGELERDGLAAPRRRQGGRHVRPRAGGRARSARGAGGLSAELRRQGGATRVEPISAEVEPAGRRVAAALELDAVGTRRRHHAPAARRRASRSRSSGRRCPRSLFPDIEDMDLGGSLLRPDGRRLRPPAGQGGRAARADGGAAVRRARPRSQAGRAAPARRAHRLRGRRDAGRVRARPLPRPTAPGSCIESTEVGE